MTNVSTNVCTTCMSAEKTQQFEEAFENYSDELFRHAFFRVSDRERALEIVHDAFAKTWSYCARGNSIDNWRAFLFRSLNNLIIDEYRKRKTVSLDGMKESETFSDMAFDELHEGGLEELEEAIDMKVSVRLLEQTLKKLPDTYRDVVVMKYIDERSSNDVAEVLGISRAAVDVRAYRGLKIIRDNWIQK